jgi:hypothetical protein
VHWKIFEASEVFLLVMLHTTFPFFGKLRPVVYVVPLLLTEHSFSAAPPAEWQVLQRASADEDFSIPHGWEAVEILEDPSAQRYLSQVCKSNSLIQ